LGRRHRRIPSAAQRTHRGFRRGGVMLRVGE
jgi:hypothetical protein